MKKIDKKKAGIAIAAVPVIAAGTVAMVSAYKQGMEFTPTDGRKDFQANKVVFENDENALEHQDSASDEESRLLQQKNSEQNQRADLQNQADYLFEDQKFSRRQGTRRLSESMRSRTERKQRNPMVHRRRNCRISSRISRMRRTM